MHVAVTDSTICQVRGATFMHSWANLNNNVCIPHLNCLSSSGYLAIGDRVIDCTLLPSNTNWSSSSEIRQEPRDISFVNQSSIFIFNILYRRLCVAQNYGRWLLASKGRNRKEGNDCHRLTTRQPRRKIYELAKHVSQRDQKRRSLVPRITYGTSTVTLTDYGKLSPHTQPC